MEAYFRRVSPGDALHPGIRKKDVNAMSRTPMIDGNVEVKQLHAHMISTTRRSFAPTVDTTKEFPLHVAVIAHHQKTVYCQLRACVRDNKPAYTKVKLHRELLILHKDKIYIPKAS